MNRQQTSIAALLLISQVAAAPAIAQDDLLDELLGEAPTEPAPTEAEPPAGEPPAPETAREPAPEAAAAEPYDDTIPVPDREAPVPRLAEKSPPRQIEEIIVTATKREESAREIPVSINALKGEDLEKLGARDLKDYIAQVPGITLQDNSSGEAGGRNLSVRGVGPGNASASSGNSGNQTVGQFIGDVPMTDPYSNFVTPDLDPYDLRSVEILKGPQGTTFGASALNGAIRYIPNPAEPGRWSARGFAEHLSITEGGADTSYGAAVNIPAGESFALRLVGVQTHVPGVYDNLRRDTPDADSREKWSARALARWEPSERFSLDLLYLKQQTEQDALISATNGDGRLENNRLPGPSSVESGFELASLDARYEFDSIGTLVLQGSHQRKNAIIDSDSGATGQIGLELLSTYGNFQTEGYSGELRLVSPSGGDWNWIGGVFVSHYTADAFANLYVANTAPLGRLRLLVPLLGDLLPLTDRGLTAATTVVKPEASETSFYGELSRRLGQSWELTLGLRRYETKFEGERSISTVLAAGPTRSTARFDQGEDGYSPKVSLKYDFSDDVMAYITVARGFQFGGANAPPAVSLPVNNPVTGRPVPVSFASSDLWSRELGLRTTWLDRSLLLDLTLFDLDWSNAQFGQDSGGIVSSTYVDNVGKVRSQGVEGAMTWLTPLDGLTLNIAASYIRARTAAAYEPGDGSVVPSGSDMPASPRVQAATTLSYSPMLGPWQANASLMHSYWGPAWNNIEHESRVYDFHLLNVLLSVARPDWTGAPALALGITNITDERNLMNYTSENLTGDNWVYGRPRAVSLRFSAEF